ncbi:phosphoribosylaminoimidazolesuccinocarboxamide synthase [Candidatus Woesearchaeota archaeon]|nr:phosphoribosylaminoimidazolesuccinocarboxamide synthase [Candidatus Woesearchaeota archaeon]
MTFLTDGEAQKLVDEYWEREESVIPLQEILDSGEIPHLKGYKVKPGKASDNITGGQFSYIDKKSGEHLEFENPPLHTYGEIPLRIMVRTKRISTHDKQRGEIPFKDQILAANHDYMRRFLRYALGSSQFETGLPPTSVVIVAEDLRQISVENVVRAYMAKTDTETSLYVHYMRGEREFCGHSLPDGFYPNCQLPYVMDSPSTKSDEHDESVSPQMLFERGICTSEQYAQIRNAALFAFGMVHQFFYPRGIIPVDTKTEHGINRNGEIVVQDEIWTLDSSRFWKREDYALQSFLFQSNDDEGLLHYLKETQPGIKEKDYTWNSRVAMCPRSLSKEFARGFSQGDQGYTPDQAKQIAVRYIEGVQELLGQRFEPDLRPYNERVISGLHHIVENFISSGSYRA